MTKIMNPQEYEDLIKKLRHLRVQEAATEKTLTEIRIQKAELIKEHIDRADHGQKAGIYEAAGVTCSEVAKDLKVKEMLANLGTFTELPSHAILQIIAATSVPEDVRDEVLNNPRMTAKEVRAKVQGAKPKAEPVQSLDAIWAMYQRMTAPDQAMFQKRVNAHRAQAERDAKAKAKAKAKADAKAKAERDAKAKAEREGFDKEFEDSFRGTSDRFSGFSRQKAMHCVTLGVSPNATPREIKTAARTMQNKHHPDKRGDAAMFIRIQEAYAALKAMGAMAW